MSELLKAWRNGKRGKFRRIDGGKLKFIRSADGVVEKQTTSTAGMAADLGTPAADVHMTDKAKVCACGQEIAKCSCVKKEFPAEREAYDKDSGPICKGCRIEKSGCSCGKVEKQDCDCAHDGLCRDAKDCDCDCDDRATCTHKAEVKAPAMVSPENVTKLDALIETLESRLG